MRISGISTIGKNHKKNHDYYLYLKHGNKKIVVVSDGLGSKKNSDIGAKRLCESIKENILKTNFDMDFKLDLFLSEIHKIWVNKIKNENIEIKECYATALFLVLYKNKLLISGRLGDGFIVFCEGKNIHILNDKKEDKFINETNCMTEKNFIDYWDIKVVNTREFKGAMLCTDGVEIRDDDYKSFTKDFLNSYSCKKIKYIRKDIKSWFLKWPGNDDKTLVYMLGWRGKKV